MASKQKKRHYNTSAAARQRAEAARVADEKDRYRKRMDPTARNLLLFDLVFMAVTAILEEKGIIPLALSNALAVVGLILVVAALYFQFGKKNSDHGSSPRLK